MVKKNPSELIFKFCKLFKKSMNKHINLGTLKISRILNGMWQVSGGHGIIDQEKAIAEMIDYHKSGLTTWDMADIYGPAESLYGKFKEKLEQEKEKALEGSQGLTKFVPNPGPMTRAIVQHYIDRSKKRMQVDAIDLVQFHWWDYQNPSYMDAIDNLFELKEKSDIKEIGLTNFDTIQLEKIVDKGYKIVSNQVQYSILDRRPEKRMVPFCKSNGIKILTYGTLLGGFFSEKYLGTREPTDRELYTFSLQKYKKMIDAWGGWELFQKLLNVLYEISQKYNVSMANIATKFILDKPQVGGVIIGARLGLSQHIEDNNNTFDIVLNNEDISKIENITEQGNDLFEIIGDCGDEYR